MEGSIQPKDKYVVSLDVFISSNQNNDCQWSSYY